MPKTFTRIEPTSVQVVGDRFKSQVVVKRFRTEDGLEHEFTTFVKEGDLGVAVLALTDQAEVIISHQFRAGRESYCKDLPGGAVEDGEDIEQAARRELLEETGYRPGEMSYLGKNSWLANSNFTAHYFFATGCVKVQEPQHDKTESDQGLEVALISIEELIASARADEVTDAVAVLIAYDMLKEIENGRVVA